MFPAHNVNIFLLAISIRFNGHSLLLLRRWIIGRVHILREQVIVDRHFVMNGTRYIDSIGIIILAALDGGQAKAVCAAATRGDQRLYLSTTVLAEHKSINIAICHT
jgi:hypothetical protein